LADKTRPSKRQLEIQLAKLKILETPTLKLEQYPVSPEAAAELLYMAGFEHDDLKGRVIDLGTGTGRLAIGAALMGSKHVVGVDLDQVALALAQRNAETARVDVEWVESDIDRVREAYDTVIMNPPYGTRTAHADTRFLDKAFQIAPVTYSIHKSSTREFLVKHVDGSNLRIDEARRLEMKIPHLFSFHTRKWSIVEVDLYRILR
jgi:predicted RNA methylase